ncbi:hypothetical protein HGH91_29820 [Chitinophaga eiseniae]|uniref:Uncharacterized protein n=2 Tax=Chitinophaga eiseniae TaxID=634771 RepID=A0A847SHQ7_9BACT|nr:hypothetical protein [Chitinophaga eiseniae]
MRVFEQWYNHLKVADIEKYDAAIETTDMDIYCSIIIHSQNKLRAHIISSFQHLADATTEKLKSY